MSEAKRFSERLKESMRAAGYELRPVVLEREFNLRYWGRSVSFQAVRRWLRGEVVPTQDRLQVLAEWLGVDAHWLRFGERLTLTVQEKPAQWNSKLAPEEREAIEAFLALPPDKRKLFGQL
ncbi:MAG TPA: transcriptional regulator, partial [Thiotrichales bacterium]|nr:transcriptional regulator [Thiotrichales bacterium]